MKAVRVSEFGDASVMKLKGTYLFQLQLKQLCLSDIFIEQKSPARQKNDLIVRNC